MATCIVMHFLGKKKTPWQHRGYLKKTGALIFPLVASAIVAKHRLFTT